MATTPLGPSVAESSPTPIAASLSSTVVSSPKPPSSATFRYDSGFTPQSFLRDDFDVTEFINSCTATISRAVDEDFHKTLDPLHGFDHKDGSTESHSSTRTATRTQDHDADIPAPLHNLTTAKLQQLRNDLSSCHEQLKRDLIGSFSQHYPLFLALNQALSDGTEANLLSCHRSLARRATPRWRGAMPCCSST